jgi:hypothetical protein
MTWNKKIVVAVAVAILGTAQSVLAFQPAVSNDHAFRSSQSRCSIERCPAVDTLLRLAAAGGGGKKKNKNDGNDIAAAATPIEKAAWYAVETFGKVFGRVAGDREEEDATMVNTGPPTTLAETKRRLRADNERSYFLSGQVDVELYSPDCVFQDPFVAFSGRDRFVANLQNLGSFITKYEARPLRYNDDDADDEAAASSSSSIVTTKFMVKLELNLPWKPVLAWPWGVRCVIDPTTHVIVRHEESVRTSYVGSISQLVSSTNILALVRISSSLKPTVGYCAVGSKFPYSTCTVRVCHSC